MSNSSEFSPNGNGRSTPATTPTDLELHDEGDRYADASIHQPDWIQPPPQSWSQAQPLQSLQPQMQRRQQLRSPQEPPQQPQMQARPQPQPPASQSRLLPRYSVNDTVGNPPLRVGDFDPFTYYPRKIYSSYMKLRDAYTMVTELNTFLDRQNNNNDPANNMERDEFLPRSFVRRPFADNGNIRPPRMEDIEMAIRDLANSHVTPGTQADTLEDSMLCHLRECSRVAVGLMKSLCPKQLSTLAYHQIQDFGLKESIMQILCDLISYHEPKIPIDRCEDLWISRYLLQKYWDEDVNRMRRMLPSVRGHS